MVSDYEHDRIRQDILKMTDAQYEIYARLVTDGSPLTHDELSAAAKELAHGQ